MAQAGLRRPNCDFLGLKWTSNNVDKSKNLYLIEKKEQNELNEQKNDFFEHLIKASY